MQGIFSKDKMGNYDYDALPLSASVYCLELSLWYIWHTLTVFLIAGIELSGLKSATNSGTD